MDQHTRISADPRQFVELGKIGRPHGVRGEVRLFLHNPSSSLIFSLQTVLLSRGGIATASEYSIRGVKDGAQSVIVALNGIHGREAAQNLNGMTAWVYRQDLPPLEDGEFYVADLMGVTVTCDGQVVGVIVESREQGGIEVITVANDIREIQIPLVDDFVLKKDIANGILEVHNIDDLPENEIRGLKR